MEKLKLDICVHRASEIKDGKATCEIYINVQNSFCDICKEFKGRVKGKMGKIIEEIEKYYCDICGNQIADKHPIEIKFKCGKKYFCQMCLATIEEYTKERNAV